jgi:hypothetical protein
MLYERILPTIPSHAPHCYGLAGVGAPEERWLFLEYIEGGALLAGLP